MQTRMRTAAPARKVQATAVTGALVTILAFILDRYAGVDLPADVTVALGLLVATLVAYLVPPAPGDGVIVEDAPATPDGAGTI